MAYILKNKSGSIIAASPTEQQDESWELIDDNDPNYKAFFEAQLIKNDPFRESDIQLARVLEDLIEILISRNLISFTDFPTAAQKRLNARQAMRHKNRLSILSDEDDRAW